MNDLTNTPAKTPRKRHQIFFEEQGRTKQDAADSVDINKIMANYVKRDIHDYANNPENNYGYASSVTFTQAMQTVATGERMFADLPSSLRKQFNHSPADFLEFCQDSDNTAEMADLGLLSDDAYRAHLVATAATKALLSTPIVDEDELPPGEIPGD